MSFFEQIEWGPHHLSGKHGFLFFPNGYGASVITGGRFYSSEERPYELAVALGDSKKSWALCYDTPITDDVLGYQTREDIEQVLKAISELPQAPNNDTR